MKIDPTLTATALLPQLKKVFSLAEEKITLLHRSWDLSRGAPVFTAAGQYTTRDWTQWTHGFLFGLPLLAFDATANKKLLDLGQAGTLTHMLPHVTHSGVHDHGFNNVSTFGNLRRLILESKTKNENGALQICETALKCSGAVQAMRWSGVAVTQPSPHSAHAKSLGYIYSFNGPHSLFIDTLRSLRSLALSWQLGHVLCHENDKRASLLKRAVLHALTSAQFLIFHGDTPHTYDIPGRIAHEAIFNRNDGAFRSRATQQGYSPFSTWTRGLAWAILGLAEQLEFLATVPPPVFKKETGLDKKPVILALQRAARETADHYLNDASAADGIPYWDDGAPGLALLDDWRHCRADPNNPCEPVDSSAAAIAAQGLFRLGRYFGRKAPHYLPASLTIAHTLFADPYLSTDPKHQGLLLHSIYHRPNNWDFIPAGSKIPRGESSMWGDYHALELALTLYRHAKNETPLTFFGDLRKPHHPRS